MRPYSNLVIIVTDPFSLPNYVLASLKIFSWKLSLRYTFPIPHENVSKSFKGASSNSVLIISLSVNNTWVYEIWLWGISVVVRYQYWFSSKIPVHINIKYHMNINMLIYKSTFYFSSIVRQNNTNIIELNTYNFHIICDCLVSKVIPWSPVNIIGFFNCLGDIYPKLI